MNEYLYNHNSKEHTITLTGTGQTTPTPDISIIRLGVQTQGENLIDIQTENANLSQAVIDTIRQLGISDIRTFQYTIDRNYEFVDGNRIDRGFIVRNILEITIRDISQTGAVIDAAVNSGANTIELVSFEVSEREMFYQEALNLAITNAIQKAESISRHLGIPVNLIPIQITENSAPPMPVFRNVAERAFATPIEPGEQTIEALVTAVFQY